MRYVDEKEALDAITELINGGLEGEPDMLASGFRLQVHALFSAHFTLSGMSLMFAALYLYLWEYGKSGNCFISVESFSLFYVGGEGISCLKL